MLFLQCFAAAVKGWKPHAACGIVWALSVGVLVCRASLVAAQPAPAPDQRQQTLETLRTGDTQARRRIMLDQRIYLRLGRDADVLDAFIAVTTDPNDGYLRGRAFIPIGQQWIWNAQDQDPKAIAAAVRLAADPYSQARYNAVYYGLSVVRQKSDEVIQAMLRAAMTMDEYEWNLHGRIAWGLQFSRESPQRLEPLFKPYLDLRGAERNKALIAYGIYVQAAGEEPPRPERFAEEKFLVRFVAPKGLTADELLAEFKRIVSQDHVLEVFANDTATGSWGVAVVQGSAARRNTFQALQASGKIIPGKNIIPASATLVARIKEGMQRDQLALAEHKAKEARRQEQLKASFPQAFQDLYDTLGRKYPAFALKQIDWKQVGDELLPEAKQVSSADAFGLLVLRLVARLEDSHALVEPAAATLPKLPFPAFDPGLACVIDDRDRPVVFHLDKDGPAEKAGVKLGMAVVAVNGKPAQQALEDWMKLAKTYVGYSSDRVLQYDAARLFLRQMQRGSMIKLLMEDVEGKEHAFELPAALPVHYVPRLPVPIGGIPDAANVSWKNLGEGIGYLRVRRIPGGLEDALDRALRGLGELKGLIIDVRGNSGGGFDARRALLNFHQDDQSEPARPRYIGPIALLIDGRCISAGEGWASWFLARKRARLFGTATAGASSRKEKYLLSNGLYQVTIPVKAYTGFLDRPIERRGLEPDVPVRINARDLAAGKDTVLERARQFLLEAKAGE